MTNYLISNIIIMFNNKNKKQELIKTFETQFKIKLIIATDLYSNFHSTRIYLMNNFRWIMRKYNGLPTKQMANKYNYKFIWPNNSGEYSISEKKENGIGVCEYIIVINGNCYK